MNRAEPELLIRATNGDATAVQQLLVQFLPGLRAYLRLRAGQGILERESTDDLAQSVCREILENLDRFEHGGAEGFRRWLYKTAQRKVSDRYAFYRAKKRDMNREEHADEDAALLEYYATFCTPSRAVAAREELARVEGCFADLKEEQREVILLAKVVGLSRKEIGEEMGKSEGAVRVLLSRALAELAARLAP